jgi:NAD(P)H-quinone oxidoreductase subunit 5
MSIGNVVLNSITQDLSQYGGLWSRRPITAIAYLVGAASLVAFPPLGGFWTLAKMSSNLWENHPILVGVLILVNALTAFSVMREFCLVFGGKSKPMTVRSPEGLWPLILPMTIVMGISLHLPLILIKFNLLPSWVNLNINVVMALTISTIIGIGSSAFIYLNENIAKPIIFKPKFIQNLFAYDLYTPQIYKVTIVGIVAIISNVIYWFDKYLIDGAVNLVGLITVISGQSLKYNTSGQTQYYFLSILLGVALFVGIICLPLITPLF